MKTETVTTLLKAAAIIVLVASILGGLFLGNAAKDVSGEFSIAQVLTVWIPGGIAAILIYSRATMIELLHAIKYEAPKKSYEDEDTTEE